MAAFGRGGAPAHAGPLPAAHGLLLPVHVPDRCVAGGLRGVCDRQRPGRGSLCPGGRPHRPAGAPRPRDPRPHPAPARRARGRPDRGVRSHRGGRLQHSRRGERSARGAHPGACLQRDEREAGGGRSGAAISPGRCLPRAADAAHRDPGQPRGHHRRRLPGRPRPPRTDPGRDADSRAPDRGPPHAHLGRGRQPGPPPRADGTPRPAHRCRRQLSHPGRAGRRLAHGLGGRWPANARS